MYPSEGRQVKQEVKREGEQPKPEVKREGKPRAPWSKGDRAEARHPPWFLPAIKQEQEPYLTPWMQEEPQAPRKQPARPKPEPQAKRQIGTEEQEGQEKRARRMLKWPEPVREEDPDPLPARVCSRNYAAVESQGRFGLIDEQVVTQGVREIMAHVPRTSHGWGLEQIRSGGAIQVLTRNAKPPTRLRVLFTTPARYYSPGARVTTLKVGVDNREWETLLER